MPSTVSTKAGLRLHGAAQEGKTAWDMAAGDYGLAITEAEPDPLRERMALLETLCREDADCDIAIPMGDRQASS